MGRYFCSAGHPYLLVGHGTVEVKGRNLPPLGVFPEWSGRARSAEALTLRPGDTLLFYTDGLTEARVNGNMYGERRLAESCQKLAGLDLEKLPQALLDEVLAHGHGKLQDDAAILAVRPSRWVCHHSKKGSRSIPLSDRTGREEADSDVVPHDKQPRPGELLGT